jgi:flagellar basal body P-ring formation protein FlgA
MIRTLAATCIALLLLGASSLAQGVAAPESLHPKLKPAATVTGGLVRIGDLVENAGAVADVPIFRSPDLGTTGTVSADAVVEAVRAHALHGLDTAGLTEVSVTRAARTFRPEDIENTIARALAAKFSLGAAKDITLTLDGELHPLHMQPDAKGAPRIEHLTYDGRSGRFNARLTLPNGPTRFTLRVAGRATATLEVATVAVPVARGNTLRDADILMVRRPRGELGRDFITDRAKAVGMAARTGLEPGRPLRAAELMKPLVVHRNEQVTLVYRIPGITLTVRGKATESGAIGDVISVLNEQSKRVIQGVVVGPGHVVVSTQVRHLAANFVPAYSAPNVSNR